MDSLVAVQRKQKHNEKLKKKRSLKRKKKRQLACVGKDMAEGHCRKTCAESGCYILAFHPEGARHLKPRYGASDERDALRKQASHELRLHLVDRLNKMLSIAVLPEWAPYLWERALSSRWDDRGLVVLSTDGDCVTGYWINPEWKWAETIQKGLEEGHIRFPGDNRLVLPKAA